MSSSAFNNPITHFWSCNTGTNGNSSFAQQWVNCTGGVAYAFDTKTSYSNIMYTEDYLSANKIERRLFYSVERKIVATARGELGFSRTGSFNYPVSDEGRDPLMFTPK